MPTIVTDAWSESTAQAPGSVPQVALWPVSADQHQAMAEYGILLEGDPVELVEGCLVRKNATPRIPQLDRLSTWCDVVLQNGRIRRMPIWKLSVGQYHEMARVGILRSGDAVELVDGLLIRKMTKNTPHSFASFQVRRLCESILPAGFHVRVQEPLSCDEAEPEPDLAIVTGRPEDYLQSHPAPVAVPLVIEVSDASLGWDRRHKLVAYARNQIHEYWIVNLLEHCIEVFTGPSGPVEQPHYRTRRRYRSDEAVPLVLNGSDCGHIPVRGVLPPD